MHKRGKSMIRILIFALVIAASLMVVSAAQAQTDVTAPVVTSVTPANGSTIYANVAGTVYYQLGNATPLTMKADYTDEVGGSGVDVTSVMVHLDGSNMLFNCPVQTASHVECTATGLDLLPGTHPLDIYVADLAGNLTVNRTWVTIVTDSATPSYANLTPASGSIIYTSQLNAASINDMAALRIDYDILDAAPSSGVNPMSHINDNFPPGGTMGAMISNTSCVKTPDANNPTHYSCQLNRGKNLHLGDNRLSVLLKDRVGNSNYSDPSSLNTYTVVDNVAPAAGPVTADALMISAPYSDPAPTNALSTSLTSGINTASVQVTLDGAAVAGCTVTATSVSCPTPGGLAVGAHAIVVTVADVAGNVGTATGSYTQACIPAKPDLGIGTSYAFWGSYADYVARELSVKMVVTNRSAYGAYGVAILTAGGTNGVTLSTPTPVALGDLAGGAKTSTILKYNVPIGVTKFNASLTGGASDVCGTSYTYPV